MQIQRGDAETSTVVSADMSIRRRIPDAAVESRWTASDGHSIRRIDWSRPIKEEQAHAGFRGSILFMPGRGDNYEKYLEALDGWYRENWRVTASDWRGQGASGRLGQDAVTGHIDDFSTWVDDLSELWGHWKESTPGPHILIGHSMGGHIILRSLAEGRFIPDGVVLTAPMLGFYGSFLPDVVTHLVAKGMKIIGDPSRPAWRWNENPGETPVGRINVLTHDADRYQDELWWREQRPELVMGPGSWQWVERAMASMRGLEQPGLLEAISVPLLILATTHDKLVDIKAIKHAAMRLPDARLALFGKEARHEILRESDHVRGRALEEISRFLDRILAGPAPL